MSLPGCIARHSIETPRWGRLFARSELALPFSIAQETQFPCQLLQEGQANRNLLVYIKIGEWGWRRAPWCQGYDASRLASCPHVGTARGGEGGRGRRLHMSGRASPSLRRRHCKVERFILRCITAPYGPPNTR